MQDLLRRIPPDTSLEDIASELKFIAGVRQAFLNLIMGIACPLKKLRKNCLHGLSNKTHPRQWVVHSDPLYSKGGVSLCNPTHGSGWIVQIRSTRKAEFRFAIPPTAVGG
jgi:hypothetical protein